MFKDFMTKKIRWSMQILSKKTVIQCGSLIQNFFGLLPIYIFIDYIYRRFRLKCKLCKTITLSESHRNDDIY